ncbi:MAG: hypothetical protein WA902_11955 [Thermosynechococcaceae cyanobacterium]
MLLWPVCGLLLQSPLWPFGLLALLLAMGIIGLAYWRSRQLGKSLIPY